jgi:hypothetical protein
LLPFDNPTICTGERQTLNKDKSGNNFYRTRIKDPWPKVYFIPDCSSLLTTQTPFLLRFENSRMYRWVEAYLQSFGDFYAAIIYNSVRLIAADEQSIIIALSS